MAGIARGKIIKVNNEEPDEIEDRQYSSTLHFGVVTCELDRGEKKIASDTGRVQKDTDEFTLILVFVPAIQIALVFPLCEAFIRH